MGLGQARLLPPAALRPGLHRRRSLPLIAMQTPFRNFDQQAPFDAGRQADSFFELKERAQMFTAANRQRMILRANENAMISFLRRTQYSIK